MTVIATGFTEQEGACWRRAARSSTCRRGPRRMPPPAPGWRRRGADEPRRTATSRWRARPRRPRVPSAPGGLDRTSRASRPAHRRPVSAGSPSRGSGSRRDRDARSVVARSRARARSARRRRSPGRSGEPEPRERIRVTTSRSIATASRRRTSRSRRSRRWAAARDDDPALPGRRGRSASRRSPFGPRRRRRSAPAGLDLARAAFARQVHGADVLAGAERRRLRGRRRTFSSTTERGRAAGDLHGGLPGRSCSYDPSARALAVAHVGWRGTVRGAARPPCGRSSRRARGRRAARGDRAVDRAVLLRGRRAGDRRASRAPSRERWQRVGHAGARRPRDARSLAGQRGAARRGRRAAGARSRTRGSARPVIRICSTRTAGAIAAAWSPSPPCPERAGVARPFPPRRPPARITPRAMTDIRANRRAGARADRARGAARRPARRRRAPHRRVEDGRGRAHPRRRSPPGSAPSGENRVQEAKDKVRELGPPRARGTSSATCRPTRSRTRWRSSTSSTPSTGWTWRGSSIGGPRARGRTVDALLEVNVAGEASKGGFAPGEVGAALDAVGEARPPAGPRPDGHPAGAERAGGRARVVPRAARAGRAPRAAASCPWG